MRSDIVTDVERPWMAYVAEHGVVGVRDELVSRGVPVSQAASMALWLHDQGEKVRLYSPDTAWRYRQLLKELLPPARSPKIRRAIPGYVKRAA